MLALVASARTIYEMTHSRKRTLPSLEVSFDKTPSIF